jgi:hypothetical protein
MAAAAVAVVVPVLEKKGSDFAGPGPGCDGAVECCVAAGGDKNCCIGYSGNSCCLLGPGQCSTGTGVVSDLKLYQDALITAQDN